jgi:carboxylate-amine ligase
MGAGLHPAAQLFDARLTGVDRYKRVLDQMRGLIQRTPECALHVHVGVPDPETAVRVYNGMRVHLPLLTALAGNSPFWFGRDSGLASARWPIVRGYPRHRIPPYVESYEHYEEIVAAARAHGDLPDASFLWWDARLQPKFGTVEVREMDAQSNVEFSGALAEAIQALARRCAESDAPAIPTEALSESSWRAARDGVSATLLHDGEMRPVAEIARDLIGTDAIERLLEAGGGAGRRRAAYEEGGMTGMLADLVEETAG